MEFLAGGADGPGLKSRGGQITVWVQKRRLELELFEIRRQLLGLAGEFEF